MAQQNQGTRNPPVAPVSSPIFLPFSTPQPQPFESSAERYANCYFEGDHVVLSLGPKPSLFRVQRAILAKYSATFQDMFTLPPPVDKAAEGSSDDNPIRLPDDPEHFAGVLRVYYGAILMPHPPILTVEYITGVLRVASKYDFALAVEWAWSNIRASWSWMVKPWLDALGTPSQCFLKEAIMLINMCHELHDHAYLGPAFYLLCVDEKWYGEKLVYGGLRPDDMLLLLKGSRSLYRLWAEKCQASPAQPSPAAAPAPPAPALPAPPRLFGQPPPFTIPAPTLFRPPPAPSAAIWDTFIRETSTMVTVCTAMGLSCPLSK
ncbi:hypothetical protein BOTBODRAFT_38628 [Botryobasidium botryosum FD-172 SS1]|uniref:BTB domain-containing protein n=1 Tax=Botryobasidium botryosum (strain FD-172 SS1) TaxID=930990 RepID=A0A067M6Y0_BOTB1|nr:hypothetical protein BOTBODRAFT_38628 [Botryobasidium botryosum FD-172 SS1]